MGNTVSLLLKIYLMGPTEYILCFCKMAERNELHKGWVFSRQNENTKILNFSVFLY